MKRFTTKTIAVFAIVVGMATVATAQKKSVTFTPLTNDIYSLKYFNQGDCKVKAEVLDDAGDVLSTTQLNQEKSFTKQFSFQNLAYGDFSFRVTDSEGIYITKIKRTEDGAMTASISEVDNGNAKVVVNGKFADPIYINIYEGDELLAENKFIDQGSDFSEEYTFENVNKDDLVIEVIAVKRVLASVKF